MVKRDVCVSEIWQCDPAEARKIWKDQPAERWRIWTPDEITAYMLASPEEIAAALAQKRAKPGKLPNIPETAPPADPSTCANWCERERALCSEMGPCGGVMAGSCR